MTLSFTMLAAAENNDKSVLDIQQWKTKQNIPVYFVATPELPMVDIDVVFNAGSGRDDDKQGLASMTLQMLDEGAGDMNTDQIAESFENVGANYSVQITQDIATAGFRSMVDPKYLNPAVETFRTVLVDPKFPNDAYDRMKKRNLVSLEQMKQSPSSIAREAFSKAVYGDQAYGHLTIGTKESVPKLTPKDSSAFHQKYYVASNAKVVIVGDLTTEKAKAIAEAITSALPKGEKPAPIPQMKPEKVVNQNIEFPSQQTTIIVGQLGIKPNDPDYFPLLVGNHILGGNGLVSRFFNEVREKRGLVYGIGSRFSSLAARGSFYVSLQTRKEEATNALNLTKSILKKFVEKGPTKQELEASKKNLIGSFPLKISSNTDIANQLMYMVFYGIPLDYLDTYRENIEKVTAKDVQKAFEKHINPEKLTVVTVGDSKAVKHKNVAKKKQ